MYVGTFWSCNRGVWWSEPNEQYKYYEHKEYDDEYDDGDYYDDGDHNEEDDAPFIR